MLLLKILAPITIMLLVVFQILLKRKPPIKSIVKFKKLKVHVPKAIIGLALLTIMVVLYGHFTSEYLKSTLLTAEDNLNFQKESSELNLKFEAEKDSIITVKMNYLKGTITSFEEVALKNYPELDSITALKKLIRELKAGNQVAASGIFKPFSKERKQAIKQKLQKVRKAHRGIPKIKFHVDQKTPKNDTIIRNLAALLDEAEFLTDFESGSFPRSDIARSWEIHMYSKHTKLIQEILHHIKPYINPNYAIARRDTKDWDKILGEFPENEVHFYIYTSPNFNNDGQVTY